jgi:hypothetical protein
MRLTALLTAAATPVGPAAQPNSSELRDSFGGEVDGGGFFHARHLSSRELIQRYDFATGQRPRCGPRRANGPRFWPSTWPTGASRSR